MQPPLPVGGFQEQQGSQQLQRPPQPYQALHSCQGPRVTATQQYLPVQQQGTGSRGRGLGTVAGTCSMHNDVERGDGGMGYRAGPHS
jgi:hypothetical protein